MSRIRSNGLGDHVDSAADSALALVALRPATLAPARSASDSTTSLQQLQPLTRAKKNEPHLLSRAQWRTARANRCTSARAAPPPLLEPSSRFTHERMINISRRALAQLCASATAQEPARTASKSGAG